MKPLLRTATALALLLALAACATSQGETIAKADTVKPHASMDVGF